MYLLALILNMAVLLMCSAVALEAGGELHADPPEQSVNAYRIARELVDARWSKSWHEDLACAQPKRKGLVPKVALGTQSPTLRIKREEAGIFVSEQMPVYVGCQVFISDKWRFIFVRQPKSSSTAVITAIKTQLCGLADRHAECKPEEFRVATEEDMASLEHNWKHYFVFTFVRNPWTRMLSAWRMFTTNLLFKREGEDGSKPGDHCGVSFEEFSQNSNEMRDICSREGCCVHIKALERWKPEFLDEHITDQSHCVFLPGGESMVDFIGASESIDDDWREECGGTQHIRLLQVVKEINKRSGTTLSYGEVSNPNGRGSEETGGVQNSCELDSVRSMFNETTLRGIALQYSMDVVNFGYMI